MHDPFRYNLAGYEVKVGLSGAVKGTVEQRAQFDAVTTGILGLKRGEWQ